MPALFLLFFFVIECSVLMALVFYNKGMSEKVKNPAILGFFNIQRTQLNAAYTQLREKLRPIAFTETCRFLTILSLEYEEIWRKTSSETTWSITKI